MNIGANKRRGQKQPCSKEAMAVKQRVDQMIEPLNNRLHFL